MVRFTEFRLISLLLVLFFDFIIVVNNLEINFSSYESEYFFLQDRKLFCFYFAFYESANFVIFWRSIVSKMYLYDKKVLYLSIFIYYFSRE